MRFIPKHYIATKDLLVAMVHAEIKTRNRNHKIGILWEIIDPILLMFAYFFVIEILFHRGENAYLLYLYTALICWRFTEKTIQGACVCFRQNRSLLQQTYFPRILLPMAVVGRCLYEFLFSCVGLAILLVLFRSTTLKSLAVFPVILFIQILFNFALALIFSVFGALFSDTEKVMKFVLKIGWYLSPGLFSIDRIPHNYVKYFLLNPMAHFFEMYRSTTIQHITPSMNSFLYVILLTCAIIVCAIPFFMRLQTDAVSSV